MADSFRELIAFNHFNRIGAGRLVDFSRSRLFFDECRPNKLKTKQQQQKMKERKKEADSFVTVAVVAAHQSDEGEPQKVSLNVHELHEKNQWQRVRYDTTWLK